MSNQFTDNKGRAWVVEVNVTAIKRVRDRLGIDLLSMLDDKAALMQRLLFDAVLLVDILYVVCEPQCNERSVTDEDFGAAMAGDPIEVATGALLEQMVSFSPHPKDRAALGKVVAAMRSGMEQARERVYARLETDEVDRAVAMALDKALGEPLRSPGDASTSSPESSASTPEGSRSES